MSRCTSLQEGLPAAAWRCQVQGPPLHEPLHGVAGVVACRCMVMPDATPDAAMNRCIALQGTLPGCAACAAADRSRPGTRPAARDVSPWPEPRATVHATAPAASEAVPSRSPRRPSLPVPGAPARCTARRPASPPRPQPPHAGRGPGQRRRRALCRLRRGRPPHHARRTNLTRVQVTPGDPEGVRRDIRRVMAGRKETCDRSTPVLCIFFHRHAAAAILWRKVAGGRPCPA